MKRKRPGERPSKLRQERISRGWSPDQLAARLAQRMQPGDTRVAITPRQIGRWERGENHPHAYWLEKLCAEYDKTPEQLGLLRPEDRPEAEDAPDVPDVRAARECPAGEPIPDSLSQSLNRLNTSLRGRALDPDDVDASTQETVPQPDVAIQTVAIQPEIDQAPHPETEQARTSHCPRARNGARREAEYRIGHKALTCSRRHRPTAGCQRGEPHWDHYARACWLALGALAILLATSVFVSFSMLIAPSSAIPVLPAPSTSTANGYVIAVERQANQDVLVTLDPVTGVRQQLVPRVTNVLASSADAAGQATMSFLMPAYSAARHALAYIGLSADGAHSLWVARLAQAGGGRPHLAGDPSEVLSNCGAVCNTLAWSPSGQWLIYESATGLIALNTNTHEQRILTQGSHDAWPACSPDGMTLAYQHDVERQGYLVALPATDCLPTPDATLRAQIVGPPIIAWHPTWSADGRYLAFAGSSHGTRVYLARDIDPSAAGGQSAAQTAAHPISDAGCADPTWAALSHSSSQASGDLVVFVCTTHAEQRLVAADGDTGTPGWQLTIADQQSGDPAMYNPVWVAG